MADTREPPSSAVLSRGLDHLSRALDPIENVACAVGAFYDDEGTFAGKSFLCVPSTDPNTVDAADLLAVTLMGEMFPPLAVRAVLGDQRREIEHCLSELPVDSCLEEEDIDSLHEERHAVLKLWRLLMKLDGVGPTKVSKLLARKRPHLVPIYDSVIGEHVASVWDYWYVFHAFMKSPGTRPKLEDLAARADLGDMPPLRVLDTAVWIRYSNGQAARAVRERCGLTKEPRAVSPQGAD